MSTFWHRSMHMFNLRTVATQNCNNPTFVKNFIFHIIRATEYSWFHPKGPFPIKRLLYVWLYTLSTVFPWLLPMGTINIWPYLPAGTVRGRVQLTSAKSCMHSSRVRVPSKCTSLYSTNTRYVQCSKVCESTDWLDKRSELSKLSSLPAMNSCHTMLTSLMLFRMLCAVRT